MRRKFSSHGQPLARVLVADDNADLRELVAHQVRKLGVEVLLACNGQEAMDMALMHDPQIVLMDLEMPVLNGLDAVAQLRARGFEGLIVAFTGHEDGPRTEGALATGCNAVLRKPLSATKLRARMAEFLAECSGSTAASAMRLA